MGQTMRGISPEKNGTTWQVDKRWRGTRFRCCGFVSYEEAERWLIAQLAGKRAEVLHGERPAHTFEHAAAHYVILHKNKVSLETDIALFKSLMPHIGHLELHKVHDGTLAAYVAARLTAGRKHKTINTALSLVGRVLNLAAHTWRNDDGRTWLETAPKLTLLPLKGFQREPTPISWGQQRTLMPLLPDHLARMALFTLNTGARDDVVCSLQWEWEIPVPELGVSVFDVPIEHVKGRRLSRLLVLNSVAQSVLESVRGLHPQYCFVYRRERVKNVHLAPKGSYKPIETMNNTAWQTARAAAGLGDLHVHDLRHTVGMRLREAGVPEATISDVLWHAKKNVTQHYTMAQIVELHAALEKVKAEAGGWNKTLATLRLEHAARKAAGATPRKLTAAKAA